MTKDTEVMTYTVSLNNNRSWIVIASDKKDAVKVAIEVADFVDLWEWTSGKITVKPYYDLYYDYESHSIYDNGKLAIKDWSRLGTMASNDGFRPSSKYLRGLNGFLYQVNYYHDGTFMCVERV